MGKYACLLLLAAAAAACNTSEKTSTVEVEEPASAVTEYTPAPGQFINSTDAGFGDRTITTPEEAVAYAEERLSRDSTSRWAAGADISSPNSTNRSPTRADTTSM